MALNPESIKSKAGLVLTGGGARAAYQVGVLKAVRTTAKANAIRLMSISQVR